MTLLSFSLSLFLQQPFNGLEIFDPNKWMFGESHIPADAFKLPTQCVVEEKLGCINGTLPGATAPAADGKRFQGMFKALE